ncbi:MAG: hypothetical protein IJV22_01900 [Bacteroidales bacterium]|nr:hypothetical protein [Bacteroidales bacterium]
MAAHHTKSTMKRTIVLLAMTALMGVAFAQEYVTPEEKWKFAEVNGHNYHGYVFHKDWKVDVNVENQDGRYTPTDEDIALVEKMVKKKIAYLNRHHENQEGMCPIIDEHMDKYERQYVGFTDLNGYRIVWVNYVWDDKVKKKLSQDIVLTEGGCGHYWHLKVNVDTEKVYGLEVNGSGSVRYIPRKPEKGPRISKPRNQFKPQRIRKTGIIHSNDEKQF